MTNPISPERLNALQTQWVRLAASFHVEPIDAYPVFDRVVDAYQQPHRHYHTLEHIAEMLKIIGRLAPRLHDPGITMLAVWFHDAVYDPHASDNEAQSARLAHDWLQPFRLTDDQHDRLRHVILATDHRSTNAITGDAVVLVDADLAILAAEEKRYARYAAAIRAEYQHVPTNEYIAGRSRVLRAFLARDRIFHTELLFDEGEAQARRNIAAELASLTGQAS